MPDSWVNPQASSAEDITDGIRREIDYRTTAAERAEADGDLTRAADERAEVERLEQRTREYQARAEQGHRPNAPDSCATLAVAETEVSENLRIARERGHDATYWKRRRKEARRSLYQARHREQHPKVTEMIAVAGGFRRVRARRPLPRPSARRPGHRVVRRAARKATSRGGSDPPGESEGGDGDRPSPAARRAALVLEELLEEHGAIVPCRRPELAQFTAAELDHGYVELIATGFAHWELPLRAENRFVREAPCLRR